MSNTGKFKKNKEKVQQQLDMLDDLNLSLEEEQGFDDYMLKCMNEGIDVGQAINDYIVKDK